MRKLIISFAAAVLITAAAMAQSRFGSTLTAEPKGDATIYGVVECDGKPLAGVAVSDGIAITLTDNNGCYSLRSAKHNGYVAVSAPAAYEYPVSGSLPQFWAQLSQPSSVCERHDFRLRYRPTDRFAIIAVSDAHLTTTHNDIEQLQQTVLPSLSSTIERLGEQPMFAMNMGDSSHDRYWYDTHFAIEQYRQLLAEAELPIAVFHTMGNHDNDGATPHSDSTDFAAAARYRRTMGPAYYSFNRGKAHIVMLDNIVYLNDPLRPTDHHHTGIVGRRNTAQYVTAEQLEWLRRDLALVADKSAPLIIGMHSPLYLYDGASEQKVATRFSSDEAARSLTECLEGFTDVHFLTGHTHETHTTHLAEQHLTDHNITSLCGCCWQTGFDGYPQLGFDGEPAGYALFEIDGTNLRWTFIPTELPSTAQFRVFDMNAVRQYSRASSDYAEFIAHYPQRTDYRTVADNTLYLNVWAWEPSWRITVTEDGKPREVRHRMLENPQLTFCYDIPSTVGAKKYGEAFGAKLQQDMFIIECRRATSTVKVSVTDGFGRTYTQSITRPKQFTPHAN